MGTVTPLRVVPRSNHIDVVDIRPQPNVSEAGILGEWRELQLRAHRAAWRTFSASCVLLALSGVAVAYAWRWPAASLALLASIRP